MKKIMKKALSLMLVLALVLVPMTAMAVDYPLGSEMNYDPLSEEGAEKDITVGAGSMYYFQYLPAYELGMGDYTITVTGPTGFQVAYYGNSMMPFPSATTYDENGVATLVATTSMMMNDIKFVVLNENYEEATTQYHVVVSKSSSGSGGQQPIIPVGTYDNPDSLILDASNSADIEGGMSYYFEYVATEEATLTITADVSPVLFDVAVNDEWIGYTQESHVVSVYPGDVVLVEVNRPQYDSGTVAVYVAFEAGVNGGGDGDQGGDGGDQGGDEVNYEMGVALEVGTNEYAASLYPYTVYTFDPTEVGEYTISSTDSVLGIVSYNGMWVTIDPSAETVSESTLVWECISLGQSIWVAAMPETNISTITVTRDELDDSDEIPWTVYENVKAPTAFEYKDDASKLQYIDIEDGVQNTAVLGEDGYYHLDKADGPILFANLNDELMSLVSMVGYGKIAAIYYENDEVVEKVDYTEALLEYIENAYFVDDETTLYPLTADLIEIFQEVGASNNWYDADNEFGVGSSEADAWMFACYYDEAITSLAPSTDGEGGATGGAVTDGGASSSTPSTSVQTGDNVNVFAWVAVMMLGLATVAVVLRKRAR